MDEQPRCGLVREYCLTWHYYCCISRLNFFCMVPAMIEDCEFVAVRAEHITVYSHVCREKSKTFVLRNGAQTLLQQDARNVRTLFTSFMPHKRQHSHTKFLQPE